jgi:hypothetical protein
MPELLIGCPISHRAWIVPRWHDHVKRAAAEAGVSFSYAFVMDQLDTFTLAAIEALPNEVVIDFVDDHRQADERVWNAERYWHMVEIRNRLLRTVQLLDPPLFLSLDSDILLHPDALKNMIESTDKFDVVGGKAFMMSTGLSHPSWGFPTTGGGIHRSDAHGVFAVDIVMAIKLLTPKAYGVQYEFHSHGEDVGFSRNCRAAGLGIGVDARVCNKHVMTREWLERIDERCGF